jgi:hypothetical protein
MCTSYELLHSHISFSVVEQNTASLRHSERSSSRMGVSESGKMGASTSNCTVNVHVPYVCPLDVLSVSWLKKRLQGANVR